jgi:hypothetical protein
MVRIARILLLIIAHGYEGQELTDRLAPPGYSGNPWGPEATHQRQIGDLPPIPYDSLMAQRDRWARENLRDGDIVFRRGDARILFGYFPFSRFLANASGSRYSHTGIAAIEDGTPVVYDTTKAGVRRQPFGVWMLDNVGPFGVKRLKTAHRDRIPAVLAFCRRVYVEQVPFDFELGLGDDELYCVEMTEKAFRAAGLPLSEPVKLRAMERAREFPLCMTGLRFISHLVLDRPLSLDQPVFFPGNSRHGIWSAACLETVTEQ